MVSLDSGLRPTFPLERIKNQRERLAVAKMTEDLKQGFKVRSPHADQVYVITRLGDIKFCIRLGSVNDGNYYAFGVELLRLGKRQGHSIPAGDAWGARVSTYDSLRVQHALWDDTVLEQFMSEYLASELDPDTTAEDYNSNDISCKVNGYEISWIRE